VIIELQRKLVGAGAETDCYVICGNDFDLGSVYAVAAGDRGVARVLLFVRLVASRTGRGAYEEE
jgi:hypothetical protein